MAALLKSLLYNWGNVEQREECLYKLMEQRASNAMGYAYEGLGIDSDEAYRLVTTDRSSLPEQERKMSDRVKAATDNIINFSVCEEYQLYDEIWEQVSDANNSDDLDIDPEDFEEFELWGEKYNDRYASVENSDIKYAAIMAAWWIKLGVADWVVYWTQNDALVRPWHMALQGYAAHPDDFPAWMIPPIEYNCRCFLETLELGDDYFDKLDIKRIKAAAPKIKKPKQLSDVYSESLAKCGRIFGPTHPYFQVKEKDKDMLKGFVERLKQKYYGEIQL